MELLLEVLLIVGVLVGISLAATSRAEPLREDEPDRVDPRIPAPGDDVTPGAVDDIRFGVALRGYRMDEVDAALDRLRDELVVLRDRLATAQAGAVTAEPEVPAPVVEAAPAVEPALMAPPAAEPAPMAPPAAEPAPMAPPAAEPAPMPPPAAEPAPMAPPAAEPALMPSLATEPVLSPIVAPEQDLPAVAPPVEDGHGGNHEPPAR